MNLQKKRSLFLPFVLIASLVFAGCAPRAGGSGDVESETAFVNLPAIVVDYAEDGEASLFNMPVSDLGDLLGGADLSALSFEAETVASMTGAGVENIQIDNQPGGIRIYMNKKPLPSLVWDDEVRTALADTLDGMGVDAGPAGALLPLLPDMGVGLAMRMPGAQNTSLDIPNADVIEADEAESILNTVRNTPPSQVLEITYSDDGSFETGQIPFMLQFAPIPWEQLELPADTIASVGDMGIESLDVTLLADGLAIAVNDNQMPYLQWTDQSEFNNMMSLLPILLGPDSGVEGMLGMLPMLLGLATGLNISIDFPAAG